jgi:hypothetical protein
MITSEQVRQCQNNLPFIFANETRYQLSYIPIDPMSGLACKTLGKQAAWVRYGFFLPYGRMPSAVAARMLSATCIPTFSDRFVNYTKLVFCEFDRHFNRLFRWRLNLWIVKTYWFSCVHLILAVCVIRYWHSRISIMRTHSGLRKAPSVSPPHQCACNYPRWHCSHDQ